MATHNWTCHTTHSIEGQPFPLSISNNGDIPDLTAVRETLQIDHAGSRVNLGDSKIPEDLEVHWLQLFGKRKRKPAEIKEKGKNQGAYQKCLLTLCYYRTITF